MKRGKFITLALGALAVMLASACEKSPVKKAEVISKDADCSRFELLVDKLKAPTDERNKKLLVLISDGRFDVPGADLIDQHIVKNMISEDGINVVLQVNSAEDLAATLPCYRQLDDLKVAMGQANVMNFGRKPKR